MESTMYHPKITTFEGCREQEGNLERPFNPFRQPATEIATAFVCTTATEIEGYETRHGLRKRRRRSADQETFFSATQAVVCDLAINALREGGNGVFASRSNRNLATKTRYDNPANTRQLRNILDALASSSLSMARQELGGDVEDGMRRRTVIRPGPKLLSLIERLDLRQTDFKIAPGGETIVLKRPRHDYWDDGGYLEYSDTDLTQTLREELKQINSWLACANVGVVGGARDDVDLTDRQMRRVFTQGRFDCGGRLFGGFWQPMPKQDRLRSLLIDGEAILEVDYGQIMPRLVYAMCGVKPPMEDLYTIPGFERHRDGIKKVMCSMMFNRGPVTRMPKGTRHFFPKNVKIGEVVGAIEAAHPAIKAAFGSGVGHRCQFKESQILMSVLVRLCQQGSTALPIHDAVLVPASTADVTQQVMLDVFREMTGANGVVEVVGR